MLNGFWNTVDSRNAIQTNLRQLFCSYFHYLQTLNRCHGANTETVQRASQMSSTFKMALESLYQVSVMDADTIRQRSPRNGRSTIRWKTLPTSTRTLPPRLRKFHQQGTFAQPLSPAWNIGSPQLQALLRTRTALTGRPRGGGWQWHRRQGRKPRRWWNRKTQTAIKTANHYPSSMTDLVVWPHRSWVWDLNCALV